MEPCVYRKNGVVALCSEGITRAFRPNFVHISGSNAASNKRQPVLSLAQSLNRLKSRAFQPSEFHPSLPATMIVLEIPSKNSPFLSF